MRKLLIGLTAVLCAITSGAATVEAQVTGIRHSDGSWTYVDANGRDIHSNGQVEQTLPQGRHQDLAGRRSHTSLHHRGHHRASGYVPWLSQ